MGAAGAYVSPLWWQATAFEFEVRHEIPQIRERLIAPATCPPTKSLKRDATLSPGGITSPTETSRHSARVRANTKRNEKEPDGVRPVSSLVTTIGRRADIPRAR